MQNNSNYQLPDLLKRHNSFIIEKLSYQQSPWLAQDPVSYINAKSICAPLE